MKKKGLADYEVVVIGCGPAGLSSAIYLGRAEVKTLIVGKYKQSQLMKAHKIENFFGFSKGIKGSELLKRGIEQTKKFNVDILDSEVINAKKTKAGFQLKLENESFVNAKILVIATGTPIRLSGIKNEEELTGKGIHYCVECDGSFYKNKKIAVMGNGNHAAEDALDLLTFSKDVTIISNAVKFDFNPKFESDIKKHKVKLLIKKPVEFVGKKLLEAVSFDDNTQIKFDAVFMACGTASALDFSAELALKTNSNILEVDENNMTSIPGIFAAGNCAGKCRQVARNVGDGCNAGLGAIRYLRNQAVYFDYSK